MDEYLNRYRGVYCFAYFVFLFLRLDHRQWENGKSTKCGWVRCDCGAKNLTALGFEVVLQDSIYVDTLARNAVLRQTPASDEIVKKDVLYI